uniref:Phosphodiesterase n=1 Tax=Ditylenchus dipsaci TaxID=166011 RepID=A0A915DJJ0_9BILA
MRWCCGGTSGQHQGEAAGGSMELSSPKSSSSHSIKKWSMGNGGGGEATTKGTQVVGAGQEARVQLLEHQQQENSQPVTTLFHPRRGVLKSSLKLLRQRQSSPEAAAAKEGWKVVEARITMLILLGKEKMLPLPLLPPPITTIAALLQALLVHLLLLLVVLALYVSPSSSSSFSTTTSPKSSTASTSWAVPGGCPFLEHLQSAGWTLHVSNPSSASHTLQSLRPVVVLFDHKIDDLISLAKNIRSLPESEDMLFGILLDGALSEKRLKALAKADLQQFFMYSATDISLCELFARLSSRLKAIPALFAVVEEAEQPIKICDERNVVQYVNRAYEMVTGRTRADVLGSDASEMRYKTLNNVAAAAVATSTPTAMTAASVGWGDSHGNTAVVPTTPTNEENLFASPPGGGGNGLHNNRRRSSEWHCITVPTSSTSPQFVYVKRGSADAAICRDLSLKSLRSQSALVDAPITEALSVLTNVLHKCDEETQMQVRDAIKILSSTELYAPTITRFRDNDRIATGYYDGLIRLHHPNRQRKRSVVDAFRENQQRRASGGSSISGGGNESRRRISTDVVNALENENSWNFDVIELERITDHHPLSQLGVKIFERWNVSETLRCPVDNIARWLTVIEANYQSGNAYHNATHAADVLQATSYFLNSDAVGQFVQDTHAVAALIAATVHDLDHPGRGNAFLMNTRQRLALLYNDHSVLENHHVALAFQLTLTQPGVNIFARVQHDEFTQIRQAVIDMVLATDMSRHFEYLTKFQQLMSNMPDNEEKCDTNSLTICRMLIKCADIANPTREWKLCHQWAMRIVEEYFEQTAEEVSKALPVTMKGFDRETCNIPITQCTFVDMFARETFTCWCEFSELPHLLIQMESNYEKWKAQAADWEPSCNLNLQAKIAR